MTTPVVEAADRRADAPPVARAQGGLLARTDLVLHLVVAAVTAVVTACSLRLWEATWSVPFVYVGDAVAGQAHAKTVLETGWYEAQSALGAPAGQTYHDFPTAENLHMVAFRVLGWFTHDSAVVINAYYVIGFPLAAVTGLWFLRRVGLTRPVAAVAAVLFAVSPYHFERNEGHLFLASYYVVPVALGVVLAVLRGQRVWGRGRVGLGPLSLLTGPGALTVAAMAVLGTGSTYYSVFTALLLGAAGLLAFSRDRSWARLAGAAGAGAALVATMVCNMLPDLLWARGRPPNALALTRYPEEAEIYALKAVQLVLPSDRHRLGAFRSVREFYNREFPLPSESPALGLVAAVGFTLLLAVVLVALVRPRLTDGNRRWTSLVELSALNLVAFLGATVGGLSSAVALVLTDNLRGWARMTILIGLFSLAAVGLVADAVVDLGRRSSRRFVRPVLAGAAALGLLVVGVVDQTSPFYVPTYAINSAAWTSDEAYVSGLEQDLPAGATVFQLPYAAFPESPPLNGVPTTDQIRMYLHSSDLRWSSGGIKGRPEVDWAGLAVQRPVAELVDRLALAGFAGVHLDVAALPDAGAATSAELTRLLGGPTRTSPDGRYRFWPLDQAVARVDARFDAEERAELADAVLLPVVPYATPDYTGPSVEDDRLVLTSTTSAPVVAVDNPRSASVRVRLSFAVRSPSGVATVLLGLPDGSRQTLDLAGAGGEVPVDLELDVAPGRSTLTLAPDPALVASGAADLAVVRFQLVDLRLDDPVLDRLAE